MARWHAAKDDRTLFEEADDLTFWRQEVRFKLKGTEHLTSSFSAMKQQGQGCSDGTHLLDGLKGRRRVQDAEASNAIL